MKQENKLVQLFTPDGEQFLQSPPPTPWNVYPRPHLKRDSFLCLNGAWDFSVVTEREAPHYEEKILVPFVPESPLSGIGRTIPDGATLCYRKELSLPDGFSRGRILLHIDAADQISTVLLNGKILGTHRGGYERFTLDLTDALDEKNTLEIFVTDELDSKILPYGKQKKKRGGMWYTPISGIWQTLWLESVPEVYIKDISVKTTLSSATLSVTMSDGSSAEGRMLAGGASVDFTNGQATVEIENPILWTPENPHLYDLTLTVGEDEISSYFALRTVTIEDRRLCLNGKPIFCHGLLDQGYFSDGIFLPAKPSGFEKDILFAKKMGFNMLRKHIKIEPEQFYYDCDRLGMIVFQDMVNNSDYSFLRDTALPTVGLIRRNDKRLHRNEESRKAFLEGMDSTVRRLSFHPSILSWTIFNEGWGQFDHESAYLRLKALDDTRPIDSTSGWFSQKKGKPSFTDFDSRHVYFKPVKLTVGERALFLSEFGGYSYKIEGHSFNLKDNYGYRTFSDRKSFTDALEKLYLDEILPAVKDGLSAAVYTQLSDIEDETNGLITYDRKVEKVDEEQMQKIATALYEAYQE
ncbi:MAG: glycoside hydrolase family 2 [Clostridia bacterium]|nr:glycoside hydrolase family 2 [Clostridia bacterium]